MDEKPLPNSEIEQALKEFEQTGGYRAVKFYNETDTPKIIKWVMKYSGGSQKQAEYILLALLLVVFGISVYQFFNIFSIKNEPTPPVTVEGPNFLR